MKSAQKIQLALENCVWLHFVLKTTFCQILRMSCLKMRFAWNLLKKYNSLFENCLTSFCVENYLLPNFKYVWLKNAFCMKSAQKIQLAGWKLCLTSFCVKNYLLPNYKHVLLKNAFCMKSAQGIQLAVENSVWLHFVLKTNFCQILRMSCSKIRFAWSLLKK